MRYLFAIVCLFMSLPSGSAQNATVDSLNKVISTTKVDTVKGRTLCRLCLELKDTDNLENVLHTAANGLKMLEKQQDSRGTAICYYSLGAVYYSIGNTAQALASYQKSLDIYTKIGAPKRKEQPAE